MYHCNWLLPGQKGSVETCIKVLSDVGKNSFTRRRVCPLSLNMKVSSGLLATFIWPIVDKAVGSAFFCLNVSMIDVIII